MTWLQIWFLSKIGFAKSLQVARVSAKETEEDQVAA